MANKNELRNKKEIKNNKTIGLKNSPRTLRRLTFENEKYVGLLFVDHD